MKGNLLFGLIGVAALVFAYNIERGCIQESAGAFSTSVNYREKTLKDFAAEHEVDEARWKAEWEKEHPNRKFQEPKREHKVEGLKYKKCPICKIYADEIGGGGIIVCFGCREVYWQEPIGAVWHVQFCPRCAKDTDPRWKDKHDVQLWEHFKLIFQRDFREPRWIACAGSEK